MEDTFDSELSRQLAGQRGGLSQVLETALGGGTSGAPALAPLFSDAAPTAATSAQAGATSAQPAAVRTAGSAEPSMLRLPGRVSSDFGWRRDPLTGAARFHRGMDIAAAYGQEVPAAAAGVVTFAGTQNGYGTVVIVRHEGGAETRYAHLSQADVRAGEAVRAGDVLGRVGQTGRANGAASAFRGPGSRPGYRSGGRRDRGSGCPGLKRRVRMPIICRGTACRRSRLADVTLARSEENGR